MSLNKIIISLCVIIILYVLLRTEYTKECETFQSSQSKAMIIVEPRKHKLLKPVIANFDKRLDSTWDLYVFHGRLNKTDAEESISNINTRKVFLKELPYDNLNADEYNALFKEESFWNQIDAEHILVFQTDAVTCANSPYKIDDFLQYGYIGCSAYKDVIDVHPKSPWAEHTDKWLNKKNVGEYGFYGIGGLSLRKKSFTLKCIKDMPYPKTFPEDVYFSKCVKDAKDATLRPESADVLMNFCSQHSYSPENKSWGAHKINEFVSSSDPFYEFCPEAKMLL